MTYAQVAEWVWENFDVDNYFTAEELIYDVKNRFVQDMAYFPIQAEDNIKEMFQFKREIKEQETIAAEQRQIEQYIGPRMESITDEIIEQIQQRPEIEYVPLSEIATTQETVRPPEIQRLSRDTFFGRFAKGIARFLGLRKK